MARENVFTLRIPSIGYEGSVAVRVVATEKCRIAFDVDNTDYKDGVFGFCEYTSALEGKLTDGSKATALKAEFPPTGLQIEGKDYYSSWVSMRKGQIITLKLDWENKSKLENYTSIAFDTNPNFNFSATDLRDPNDPSKGLKEIKITCNNTSTTPTRLEIKAETSGGTKKVAGVLNVFHPTPKKVKVKWFVVENNAGSSTKDEANITDSGKRNINLADLKSNFKKALNPALIDTTFVNAQPIILDITTLPSTIEQDIQARITTIESEKAKLKAKLSVEEKNYKADKSKPKPDYKEYYNLKTILNRLEKAKAMTKTNRQIENDLLAQIKEYEKNNIDPLEKIVSKPSTRTRKEIKEINKQIRDLKNDPVYAENLKKHKQKVRENSNPSIANRKTNLFVSNTDDQIYRRQPGETQTDREDLIELLKTVYATQHQATIEDDVIYLFLTHFKCYKNNVDKTGGEVNGYTYEAGNSCVMFMKNSSNTTRFYRDMPHEAMHALGLPHTFDLSAQHTFKEGTTDNRMDYASTAYHTFLWQWRLLHESKLTK